MNPILSDDDLLNGFNNPFVTKEEFDRVKLRNLLYEYNGLAAYKHTENRVGDLMRDLESLIFIAQISPAGDHAKDKENAKISLSGLKSIKEKLNQLEWL